MHRTQENDGIKPFWTTDDGHLVRLYCGDVVDVLDRLPAASVHCVVTSPPYWGLRDYGNAKWEGGSKKCDHASHKNPRTTYKTRHKDLLPAIAAAQFGLEYKFVCKKCGARRVSQEIGGEQSYQDYVDKMVQVFRRIHRVLRDDGTVWLNLGDCYGSNSQGRNDVSRRYGSESQGKGLESRTRLKSSRELPSGNVYGIPWRVALALQSDGWILRQDIIWGKPSPMPESIQNRCTKAHEYIFLLAKQMGYYYDADAIKENATPAIRYVKEGGRAMFQNVIASFGKKPTGNAIPGSVVVTGTTANKRSVWMVASQGYDGSHFACYPPKLIEPCILAGTSEKGCCAKCGAPWRRVVEKVGGRKTPGDSEFKRDRSFRSSRNGVDSTLDLGISNTVTVGWNPGCNCNAGVVPCTVLDPFIGSGTTCCVSVAHGRRSVGIDLSENYLRECAIPRIEGELIKRPLTAARTGKRPKKIEIGKSL